jgi:hypothetical protein
VSRKSNKVNSNMLSGVDTIAGSSRTTRTVKATAGEQHEREAVVEQVATAEPVGVPQPGAKMSEMAATLEPAHATEAGMKSATAVSKATGAPIADPTKATAVPNNSLAMVGAKPSVAVMEAAVEAAAVICPRRLPHGRSWLCPELSQLELSSPRGLRLRRRRLALYRWAVQSGRLADLEPEDGWEMLEAIERSDRQREYYYRRMKLSEELRNDPLLAEAVGLGESQGTSSLRPPRR